MAFTLTEPYRIVGVAVTGASICEQAAEFYAVRIDPVVDIGPVPFVSVGPYATADDAAAHAEELPPPLPPPPPPMMIPMPSESEPTG